METLNTEGFAFNEIAGEWAVLKADFGHGYGVAALVGDPGGTRTWSIRIAVVPGTAEGLIEAQTRAAYLWSFFQLSKAAADAPFWIELEDPATGTRLKYLASFTEHRLSYEVLCAQIYGTGLELRQRRVLGTPSPTPAGLIRRPRGSRL